MVIAVAVGPQFIEWLRRQSIGQQIRAEGPAGHIVKQGTPTMGGLLILVAALVPALVVSLYTVPGVTIILATLGCAADRLRGRLPQGAAPALARAEGPLEDARARAHHRRGRLGDDEDRLHGHRDLLPARRRQHRPRLGVLPVPLPRHRGHLERRQPHGRGRRPRGGNVRDLAASRCSLSRRSTGSDRPTRSRRGARSTSTSRSSRPP